MIDKSQNTACAIVFTLVIAAGCGRGERASTVNDSVVSVATPSVPAPLAGETIPLVPVALTFEALPPAALAALHEHAPGFNPFLLRAYPPKVVASAHQSAAEGMMIIRADLQGEGRGDYALAGMDGDSLRVIALLARADGGFLAVMVMSEVPSSEASPPRGVPKIFLERARCQFRCASATNYGIVVRDVVDLAGSARYVWIAEAHLFSLDEILDN